MRYFLFQFIAAVVFSGLARSDASDDVDWRVGKAFRQQLDATASVVWSQVPLRDALRSVVRQHQVALMLDRRIDPEQLVEFSAAGLPLQECLREVGKKYGFSLAIVGNVLYVGPASTCETLATLNELRRLDVSRLRAAARSLWQQQIAMSWPTLTEPRRLIGRIEEQSGIDIERQAAIPHDLWPAGALPKIPIHDLLTLLLAGFDMTFEMNSDGLCRLVPVPERISLTRSYRTGSRTARLAARLSRALPSADVSTKGPRIVVDGTLGDHEQVRRLISGQREPAPRTGTGEVRYTLDGKNQPVGPFLTALGRQLGLRVEFSPDAEASFNTLVTFQVENVTRDELLSAVLAPAQLAFQIDNGMVRVRPGR